MNFFNATPFVADYTFGLKKSGRNCLVIVTKATYMLPRNNNEQPRLSKNQLDLHKSDIYSGEAGQSTPLYDNDFAPYKPKCDVILHASAYSEKPVTEMIVGFRVGKLEKLMKVIGPRYYRKTVIGIKPGEPIPFTRQPISYDTAYGGSEIDNPKAPREEITYTSFMRNPVGIGFYPNSNSDELVDKPLPLTEALNEPAVDCKSTKPIPQAFGPVARNWSPRSTLGGTYDQNWSDNVAPFLPGDFNEQYYQCAPEDQQCDHLHGGEMLTLMGLVPQGNLTFHLPEVTLPMQVIMTNGDRHNLDSRVDTLTIEPDKNRFTLVWRAHVGIRRSKHEIGTLIVGTPTRGWEHARLVDKPYVAMKNLCAFGRYVSNLRHEREIDEPNNIN
ncbi:MAG: hypothetical protein B6D77_15350 [gamma proteobacterium symbiont of Ctena orbiculata]|nr:MAG: hypothetical protein B6D77_15350 [gamma proteobacterium symbiont of Ctena orbiculata]